MKNKGLKKLVLMIVLTFSLIASYAQTTLDINEAKFFIQQDAELKYLREDNKQLIKEDSVNNNIIGNYQNISAINDSIIDSQRQIITAFKPLLVESKEELKKANKVARKLENKVRVRNILLGYSTVVIILETIGLCLIL